jgi:hypothetical protein
MNRIRGTLVPMEIPPDDRGDEIRQPVRAAGKTPATPTIKNLAWQGRKPA